MDSVTLSGVALHSGAHVRVTLARASGPLVFIQNGHRCSPAELNVVRTDFGVTVASSNRRLHIDLVEHFLAALAAYNTRDGLAVMVDGPELPLLGGGALEWLDALTGLGIAPASPTLKVARHARLDFASSSYEFFPGSEPGVEVVTDFGKTLGSQRARYSGSPLQFRSAIAPARTFGFRRDRERLQQAGRARHVDTSSVLVFEDDGSLATPTTPPARNELAAHKLLDLMGDSWLYGGLPVGRVCAARPGHTTNHAAFEQALQSGVLEPT